MTDVTQPRHRFSAVMRDEERVTPLELFFDLVFVLAITQCTTLMASRAGWMGIGEGLLMLGLLWWTWVGYAWLTSVVNPEEGFVRFAMFAAMAALLVVSLCVPEAFGESGVIFAIGYSSVRVAHIALFLAASRDDINLRSQVVGLAVSTFVGIALLLAGSFAHDGMRVVLWSIALALDAGGPFVMRADGWKLVPGHFAERHGLIIIIALGESIVAVGTGAGGHVSGGVVVASILAIALTAAMWWAYFDVVALVAARRLMEKPEGKERNEMARDSYSYLHFLMIAGIVLVALGLKKTLAHVGDELSPPTVFALSGGTGIYLLGHVAFRWRNVRSINRQRALIGTALLVAFPLLKTLNAISVLGLVTTVMWTMIGYEALRFADGRASVRHAMASEPPSP